MRNWPALSEMAVATTVPSVCCSSIVAPGMMAAVGSCTWPVIAAVREASAARGAVVWLVVWAVEAAPPVQRRSSAAARQRILRRASAGASCFMEPGQGERIDCSFRSNEKQVLSIVINDIALGGCAAKRGGDGIKYIRRHS